MDLTNIKYKSETINIDDILKPLVISYENNLKDNINSLLFKKTLDKNNWEYIFIGEGNNWNGVHDKIINYCETLKKLNPKKVVILSDARDVFCCRSPISLFNKVQNILNSNKIIISSELYLIGHMNWTDEEVNEKLINNPNFFWQGIPLKKYWEYYGIKDIPNRKYVNSGLILGSAEDLLKAFEWVLNKGFNDDQLGFAHYINEFPQNVYMDTEAEILHTSTYGVNCSGYNVEVSRKDAPSFSELFGNSSYFLHVTGIQGSKGQNLVYRTIFDIISNYDIHGHILYDQYGIQEPPVYNVNFEFPK